MSVAEIASPSIPPMQRILGPGVYFGLSAEAYHSDSSLGSSDIRTIRKSTRRFWLKSKMNPDRAKYALQTKATVMGTALHVMVLDGPEIFRSRYVRRPDDPRGSSPSDKGALTKSAKKGLLSHQELLHGDEWDLIEATEDLIVEHPDLSQSLKGGENEVSVFWVADDGEGNTVPLKCRFDRLKPRGVGDLKTIENERDDRLELAAMFQIKRYKYHIQAAHYLEGRRQMAALVRAGRVYTVNIHGDPEPSAKSTIIKAPQHLALAAACAAEPNFAFQFVFVQKSFPEVWGCVLSPGNPLLQIARDQIDEALLLYRQMVAEHGVKRWPQTWRLQELNQEDMPGGEWGWND